MGTVHAPSAKHSSNSTSERRREARHLVGGEVVLLFEDPEPIEIRGRLFGPMLRRAVSARSPPNCQTAVAIGLRAVVKGSFCGGKRRE